MSDIGDDNDVRLPMLVAAQHRIGLIPLEHGSPDTPLGRSVVKRHGIGSIDLNLGTLDTAFEMIASVGATVQHNQNS